jgi:hypothetical protein
MRFFTMAWWRDVQTSSGLNPSDAYERHLASLRPLPPAVADLDRVPSLHDARVRRVEHGGGSVEITLDRWGEQGGWIPTWLSYHGVERMSLSTDPDGELPGPSGFGDLGYYEIDVAVPGLFEHRFLFSSGVEMSVRFRSFNFRGDAVQPGVAADRAAPRR